MTRRGDRFGGSAGDCWDRSCDPEKGSPGGSPELGATNQSVSSPLSHLPSIRFSLHSSIGCESDPTDELGLSVFLWTLIRLVDVWVDEGSECAPTAHEQIVRVCNHGKVPLPRLLGLQPGFGSTSKLSSSPGLAGTDGRASGAGTASKYWASTAVRSAGPATTQGAGLGEGAGFDTGSILAPLMEKLMETGHMEEFVEQVLCQEFSAVSRARSALA